ncbi:MAG: type IX secretion system protein PorQ [Tannerella sp.]|jgi:hypothetical protein|nr:type IX secretion system protein PorQ [Tannerella sp.]
MKYIQLTAFLLSGSCLLSAQEGGEVFTFLRYSTSSHVNALGGHTVSLIERDPSMIFHNPALLGGEMDGMVNLNYMNYIADIHVGSAAYTRAFRERSAWGIGARFFSYGRLKEVDASHTVLGDFSANDLSINAFYSYDLSDRWRGGVSFGMLYSGLAEYTSFGIAVDAGLSYFDPEKGLSYGITLKNIGTQLNAYDKKREKLPWDIQLGMTKKMDHAPFRFSVTAMYLNRWKFNYVDASLKETELNENFFQTAVKHLVFGLDFVPSDNFWAGIGYNPKTGADMQLKEGGNRLGGFTAGAGLRISRFDLGVSVARYHPSALSLMLSISMSLSDAVL